MARSTATGRPADRMLARAAKGHAQPLARPSPRTARESRRLACLEGMSREPVDDAWYARLFEHRAKGEVTGDVTPSYALLPPEGIAHAARMSPGLKVVALLRDPAERAFSHMVMHAAGDPTEARLLAMPRGRRWPLDAIHSDCATWLGRWRQVVGREAIHIDTMDRIRTAPEVVLRGPCALLGIPLDPAVLATANRPVVAAKVDSRGVRHVVPLICNQLAREYEALAQN